jgi:7-cyano-7-deazaguanine reductase
MLNEIIDNSQISTHLGQKSPRIETYSPHLLVKDLRTNSRIQLGIEEGHEPFIGYDVWMGYEISCLLDDGSPITGVAKVVYDCNNQYIVESKSMKLYWNSFYMTKMGPTCKEAITHLEWQATNDLSKLLGTKVRVAIFSADDAFTNTPQPAHSAFQTPYNYEYGSIDDVEVPCNVYKEDPSLLYARDSHNAGSTSLYAYSTLLKSNCRETKQPDNGDVYIYMHGPSTPTDESLKQYIVSFRGENHFHEAITDCIYSRLHTIFHPTELMVACTYVRRGGWSIAPIRASHEKLIPSAFTALDTMHYKTPRE